MSGKLDKERAALEQREAALKQRENELARKESELAKRRTELQKREAKVREQEKKLKRKEKIRERITPKEIEHLEIQTNPQVEVFVGPKVEKLEIVEQQKVEELVVKEEYKEVPEQAAVAVAAEPVVELKTEPEIEIEEPKAEEKLEIVEEPKEEEKLEIVEEPKVEEKLEVVEEPKVEEKLEVVEEPKAEEELEIVEEPKEEEKLEVVEEPKAEEKIEVVEEPKVEVKTEVLVKEIKSEKKETKPQKLEPKKAKVKSKPQKVAEYSEEFNDKRNSAMLEALKELNAKMEHQLKLDDIQAATTSMRTPESDSIVKKRRVANVATIKGYLFGLIAAYLDTLPKEDLKYIEIEGLTATEFLRFLASDYEFEFERDEDDTKSSAISKNGNFASNRFIYGAMGGYGRIINDVIENEKYAAEIKALANNWLVGSYLDETLDETAPNMRRGIEIETQKLAKRDERLEKEFGEAGQVL
jgi:hypothetical protein